MAFIAPLLAIQLAATSQAGLPSCRAAQLRLSADARDSDFNGMSHGGTALAVRNVGPDCVLPALPTIELRDARGRALPALRRAPVGMHPGPVMVPLRLSSGQSATTDLRWVSGPVYPHNRSVKAASVVMRIGSGAVRIPLMAMIYGEAGKPVGFEQSPLRSDRAAPAG